VAGYGLIARQRWPPISRWNKSSDRGWTDNKTHSRDSPQYQDGIKIAIADRLIAC